MSFRVTEGQQLARISARHNGRRDVARFNPERYRLEQAAIDYTMEEAKRIQDWPSLEAAVDAKIGEQIRFIAWWHANVALGKGGDRKTNAAITALISWRKAEAFTGMKHQRVSELSERLGDLDAYRNHLLGAVYFAAYLKTPPPRGTLGTGENEWFTPEVYIDLARKVLGKIDLDPATSVKAQKIVRATKFYTAKHDGLKQNWRGRVWLNPPFAQPAIEHFVRKMVAEYKAKRVPAAIMLTHNYSDTAWFHEGANTASAVCFTRGRVKFYKPNGKIAAPTQGQAFFFFGRSPKKFAQVFREVGLVFAKIGGGQ